MKTITKSALSAAGVAAIMGLTLFAAGTAFAAEDIPDRPMDHRHPMHHFLPQDVRQEFRADFEALSGEEKAARQEERKAFHEEMRKKWEDFTGISRDEMEQLHRDGEKLGDVLQEHGVTEQSMREFMLGNQDEHIAHMKENHEIGDDEEKSIRERFNAFIDKMIERLF